METWLLIFIGIVAVAVFLQAMVLVGILIAVRQTAKRVEVLATEVHERVLPLIGKVQTLVEDVQPRVSVMLSDAAEITTLARVQVQRMDRVLADASDRLRMQVVHADQIVTGALDTVEDTTTQIRRSVAGPVNAFVALVKGVQTGVEFFVTKGRRSPSSEVPSETQDETLFI